MGALVALFLGLVGIIFTFSIRMITKLCLFSIFRPISKDQSSKKKKKELWLTDPVISQSNLSTVQPCSVNVQPTTSAAPFVFVAKKSVAKPYTGLYPFCPTPRRNSPPPPEEPTLNLTSEFNFDETKSEASSSGTGKVSLVQEACAKCFAVHILKFEILETT